MSGITGYTTAQTFGGAPKNNYFEVRAGIEKSDAIEHAICSINSARDLMCQGIANNEITIAQAWLVRECLEAAEALLQACQ